MLSNRILTNFRHLSKWKVFLPCSLKHPLPPKNNVIKSQAVISVPAVHVRCISTSNAWRKYNKQSNKDEDSDSDDDERDPDLKDEQDSKMVKVKVNSLRADLLLRAALNIARNKVEVIFYESKIRVNGQKIAKKSAHLNIGDEIDVIKGFSSANSSHLLISRVVVVSAKEKDETISVQLRRYKTMLVENYPGANAFKSSESNSNA